MLHVGYTQTYKYKNIYKVFNTKKYSSATMGNAVNTALMTTSRSRNWNSKRSRKMDTQHS